MSHRGIVWHTMRFEFLGLQNGRTSPSLFPSSTYVVDKIEKKRHIKPRLVQVTHRFLRVPDISFSGASRQQKGHQSYLFSGAWQRLHVGTADHGGLFRFAVLLADVYVGVNIGVNVIDVVGDVRVRVHVSSGGNVAGAATALSVLARHSSVALSFHPLVVSHPLFTLAAAAATATVALPSSPSPHPFRLYFHSLIPNLGLRLGISRYLCGSIENGDQRRIEARS